jgi:hypothetical protein
MSITLIARVAAASVFFSGCYVSQNLNSIKLIESFPDLESGELSKNDVLKRFGNPDGPFDSNEWLYKSKFSSLIGFRFGADSKMTEMNVSGSWRPCRRTLVNSVPGSPQCPSSNQGFAGLVPTFADPRSNSQMNEALNKQMLPGFAGIMKNSLLNKMNTETSRDINKWCKKIADLEMGSVDKEDITVRFGKPHSVLNSRWTYRITGNGNLVFPEAMFHCLFGDDSKLIGVMVWKLDKQGHAITTVFKKGAEFQ